MDKGVAPEKRDAELKRERLLNAGGGILQTEITEHLTRTLIDHAEHDSERDVIQHAAANHLSRAKLLTLLRVLLIVKPDQTVILKIVIDRQYRDNRDRLLRHRRQQDNPVHRDRGREQQILRHVERFAGERALHLTAQPNDKQENRARE